MKLSDTKKEIEEKKKAIIAELKRLGTCEASRRLGCNPSYVSHLINGKIVFRIDSMLNIVDKLGMDI